MAALKIQYKLFAAIFTWSTILVVVLAFSIQTSLDKGMVEYVNQKEVDNILPLVEALGDAYVKEGNWQSFEERTNRFKRMLDKQLMKSAMGPYELLRAAPDAPSGFAPRRDRRPPPRPPFDSNESESQPLNDISPDNSTAAQLQAQREHLPPTHPMEHGRGRPTPMVSYVLLNNNKQRIAGYYPDDRDYTYIEIKPESEVIGYLAVSKRNALADGYELKFLDKQQDNLIFIASALLLLTFLLTLPIARHLVQPIKAVAKSLNRLSKGDYQSNLSTRRGDEFQLLFQNINNLARTLAENETARKKWFADTAHDLRTPIAIMRGELEAMLDGVRKIDATQIASIHSETLRLQRFINDLHELARSELGTQHYQKQEIDLRALIEDVSSHCQQLLAKHNIVIATQVPDYPVLYLADEFRLAQCLDNLLTNIANYAHGASRAKISLSATEQHFIISVADDGPGVAAHHLDKLFDHLYRVEGSRNRDSGGSGLGLAICKNIVKAHNGTISATKSESGGLEVRIALPRP